MTDVPSTAPPRPRANHYRVTVWHAATALLLLGTAILAVLTPLHAMYSLHGTGGVSQTLDGWGRYHLAGKVQSGGDHGLRLGILWCVAAGVAAAATAVLMARPAARDLGSLLRAAAGAAVAILTAVILLTWTNTRGNVQVELRTSAASGTPHVAFHTDLGSGLWFGVATTVCAALAVWTGYVANRNDTALDAARLRDPSVPDAAVATAPTADESVAAAPGSTDRAAAEATSDPAEDTGHLTHPPIG